MIYKVGIVNKFIYVEASTNNDIELIKGVYNANYFLIINGLPISLFKLVRD